MATPIPYPLLNGVRQSFVSSEVVFAQGAVGATAGGNALNLNLRGYKSCNYGRTRTRGKMWGNHPDPIGKTRGKNDYKCEMEMAIAEVQALETALQSLAGGASGYGDVMFSIVITHSENGFDTIVDRIDGCTLDTDEVSLAEGPDGTYVKLDFSPLKVTRNGVDDVQFPLTPITS